jgi:hypothetical protein
MGLGFVRRSLNIGSLNGLGETKGSGNVGENNFGKHI